MVVAMTLKDEPAKNLLLFRALCNFGLGLRFVMSPVLMKGVCGDFRCSTEEDIEDEHNCGGASGFLQFFHIASEAWLMCLAYDLVQTIKNPFASSAKRNVGYHVFCWTIASVFTILITTQHGMAGYWTFDEVDEGTDDVAICWVRGGKDVNVLNTRSAIFFYIPLGAVILYVVFVIFVVFWKLGNGVAKNFESRAKILLWNTVNLGIFVVYWLISAILALASTRGGDNTTQILWRIVWFFMSSKGYADLLAYICISDGFSLNSSMQRNETVDYNTLLRQHVLHYATKGIRNCASMKVYYDTKDAITLHMAQKDARISLFKALTQLVLQGEVSTEICDNADDLDTEAFEVLPSKDRFSYGNVLSPNNVESLDGVQHPTPQQLPSGLYHTCMLRYA